MSHKGLKGFRRLKEGSILLIKPSRPHQALISHDLSPLKYQKFNIQAQENNKVFLFEEMTNAPVPFE